MMTNQDRRALTASGAEFSECRRYRYFLYRIWNEANPYAMVIGLNPSTANESNDDPTIRNLMVMMDGYGYGGFYMMNLYAFISSKPEELRECPDPVKENLDYLQSISGLVDDIIFAWGSFKQAYWMAKKIEKMFPNALCFGKSKHGNPIHPLSAAVWMKSKCKLQKYA